jgi:short-subunit dehydrogenase
MPTALITGASAGIGAAFAHRLAGDGLALVLVARDPERLAKTAAELSERHGTEVEVLPADLATDDGIAAVEARLADPERPVHIEAVLRLTRAAVPGMRGRGRGYVVNVASVAAFLPRGTYGASKSWVVNFSQSLARDLAGSGVKVLALCPGFTRTEFHDRGGIDMSALRGWMWLSVEQVVDECLRDLARGRSVSIPAVRYKALIAATRKVPLGALVGISARAGRRLDHR